MGVPQAKRFRTYFSSSSSTDAAGNLDTSTAGDPLPDLQGYLARVKSSMDERRAYGLLRSLRRTCEELDRRAGVEDSPMWRDPDEEEREQQRVRSRKMFDRIDTELDSDDERKVTADSIKAEAKKAGRGELAYEIGTSETVVDSDSGSDEESAPAEQAAQAARPAEDPDEEAEWFSYDASPAHLSRVSGRESLTDKEYMRRFEPGSRLRSRTSATSTSTSSSAWLLRSKLGTESSPSRTATASGAASCITMQMTSSSTVPVQRRRSTSPFFNPEDAKPPCCRFSRGGLCF